MISEMGGKCSPPAGAGTMRANPANITCFVINGIVFSKAKMFKLIAMLPGIEQDISLTGLLRGSLKSIAEEKFQDVALMAGRF